MIWITMQIMKKPFVTKEQLEKIIRNYPTPFYLYDERGIRKNARKLKDAFAWNPDFKEYFAVKATPNPAILKIMKEEGFGLDCSSLTELMLAERTGFHDHEIFFSGNNTPKEDYLLASRLNSVINLDDISHIDFLKEIIGNLPETMCIRYNPGGTFDAGRTRDGVQVMDTPQDSKFGMTREQCFTAIQRLLKEGVSTFGLHAFLASNTLSDSYYARLSGLLFQLAVDLQKETGCHIGFINLSGGIGIPYKPEETENDIYAIGNGVRNAYEKIMVPSGMDDVSVYLESGRYMTGPYGCLVTTVLHKKHTYRNYIGVDANACNLLRPAMYGAYHHITVAGKEDAPHDHVYDIVGSLCENNDKFAWNRPLPEIDIGDILIIHDTGAHGFSMGYNYNGRLRCAELLLCEDGTIRQIRRQETPEDYFATII